MPDLPSTKEPREDFGGLSVAFHCHLAGEWGRRPFPSLPEDAGYMGTSHSGHF